VNVDEGLLIRVHPDAALPAEVVGELMEYRSPVGVSGEARGVWTEVLANALGGIVAAGLWDVLPKYAKFLVGASAPVPVSPEEVVERVLETLDAAGVMGPEAAVLELVNGPGEGWTGLVRENGISASFHSSPDGTVVAYRVLP
jgi:hypothetical protein